MVRVVQPTTNAFSHHRSSVHSTKQLLLKRLASSGMLCVDVRETVRNGFGEELGDCARVVCGGVDSGGCRVGFAASRLVFNGSNAGVDETERMPKVGIPLTW